MILPNQDRDIGAALILGFVMGFVIGAGLVMILLSGYWA